MKPEEFKEVVWQHGRELYRDMPWRVNTEPYFVLVSELMLQQTQVDRVIPKFHQFMMAFPTVQALSASTLAEVLTVWSGLGYNRRAKFLYEAAQKIVSEFDGVIPSTFDELVSLPGIGPNTAGAILAYSFNQPIVFIETNIRTVYFYHLFEEDKLISDKELKEKVAQTLDTEHPREWYWALMDYGAFLKKQGDGQINRSKHYKKQAPLKGSLREVRGLILKALAQGDLTKEELVILIPQDERFERALTDLTAEKLIALTDGRLHLMR